jgi:hypothetical protein
MTMDHVSSISSTIVVTGMIGVLVRASSSSPVRVILRVLSLAYAKVVGDILEFQGIHIVEVPDGFSVGSLLTLPRPV